MRGCTLGAEGACCLHNSKVLQCLCDWPLCPPLLCRLLARALVLWPHDGIVAKELLQPESKGSPRRGRGCLGSPCFRAPSQSSSGQQMGSGWVRWLGLKQCCKKIMRCCKSCAPMPALCCICPVSFGMNGSMTKCVLPGQRNGSDEAVHNAGLPDGWPNCRADGQHVRWQAAEEQDVCPGCQLRIVVEAGEP